jgi:hypothetical protein
MPERVQVEHGDQGDHDQLLYALLGLQAKAVAEAEAARITTENRLRALTTDYGLSDRSRQVRKAQATLKLFESAETSAIGELRMTCKQLPWLVEYVESTLGVDYKGIGRLLGEIGDPALRPNVAKLWQYCGHGDPARSRLTKDAVRKGVDEDGKAVTILPFSPQAKTLLWQVADSASRQGTYRPVYEAARAKYENAMHSVVCRNTKRPPASPNGCGTGKEPELGEVGSPWRPGHKHAAARRIVAKKILKDLWCAARDHQPDGSHGEAVLVAHP